MDFPGLTKVFRKASLIALILIHGEFAFGEGPNRYPEIEYAMPDQPTWAVQVDERGMPTDTPAVRFARALFARAGIPWHGKAYPAARMFKYLQNGTAQFSILVKASALESCCLFSRNPVTAIEIRTYRIGAKEPVTSREAMVGKSVIVVRGYSYAGLRDFIADPRNRVASSEAPTHAAAFRMLASGRADYVIDYVGPAADALAVEPVPDVRSDLFARLDLHLVLSRSYPDAEQVMSRLEGIAEALAKEGAVKFPPR